MAPPPLNQAAAAARLSSASGPQVALVGQVGGDAAATVLLSALRGCGVDTRLCREVAAPTGQALVFSLPGGDNSIVIIGGAK